MITKVLETLWTEEFIAVSENVEKAKGKHERLTSVRKTIRYIIRAFKLWRRK